jgi:hypothetical protein
VISQQTKMSAWAPTKALASGTYAWRIRRLDADNKAGPWSNGRKFTLSKADTTTSIDVTKSSGDIKAAGTLTPPLAGVEMSVTLARRQNGTWVKLGEKTPAVKASGAFNASFRRPKAGACRVTARFEGDASYQASKDTVRFRC